MASLIPILVTLFCFPAFFLKYIATSTPTDPHSLTFFRLRLIGCFLQCVIFCLRGFYAAHRNNRIFFTVIATSLLIHVAAARFMLSGHAWLAPLGICSMGLSYCIAMAFGLGIYCEQWLKQLRLYPTSLPARETYYELLRISFPLTAHGIIDHIGTTLIYTTTSQFYGALPLASLHLASSIMGVAPGAGFALTALTEVSKATKNHSASVLHVGNKILLFGSVFLGISGLLGSIYTPTILQLIAPEKLQLQNATLAPMQLLLSSLCLHTGCQIILKMLQAIDHTTMSVTINLSFVYGFRIPLLFMIGNATGTSVFTVIIILVCEKMLKLLALTTYWLIQARKYRPAFTSMQPSNATLS
jgi:Na+-driven multidrug efflux pump